MKVGPTTVRANGADTVCEPTVASIARFTLVNGAEVLAVSVKADCDELGLGEKDAVTPLGSPGMVRLTLPSKPFCPFMLIQQVFDVPGTIVMPPQSSMVKVGTTMMMAAVVDCF